MIRVLIADDHAIFRQGLRSLLAEQAAIEVAGEAENGQQVLGFLENESVDVVLMDIKMPELSGIEATVRVKAHYPGVRVLALSMHDEERYIVNMLKAGATGYVLKNTGKEELVEAIETIHSGDSYFTPAVSQKLLNQFMHQAGSRTSEKAAQPLSALSAREVEVLKLISQEMTNQEIADNLCISKRTVDTHRKNLLVKLGAKNTVGLIKYALKAGLTD